MRKDYIITFATEFFILISGVLVYKLAAIYLGKEGFSEYALSKKTVSLIQPALLIGLGVGIPRFIAYAKSESKNINPDGYFISGLSAILFIGLFFILALNIFRDNAAFLLFGSPDYFYLIYPLSFMLLGLLLHSSCYAYFRGNLMMYKANLLQFINAALIPFIVFFISTNLVQILLLSGVLWIIISIGFLILILKSIDYKCKDFFLYLKDLLSYGIQRVPGDFCMAGLISLPAILTAHMAGIIEAGLVAFGISILTMAGAFFAPIGLVLLPKASQLLANKDFFLLRHHILRLLKITVFLTIIGVVFFEIFADAIITLYLGAGFSDAVFTARIIFVSAIAYTIYVSMRSIIDAYYVRAKNTINICYSMLLFIVFSSATIVFAEKDYLYIIVSFVLAIFFLGFLTLMEIKNIIKKIEVKMKQ